MPGKLPAVIPHKIGFLPVGESNHKAKWYHYANINCNSKERKALPYGIYPHFIKANSRGPLIKIYHDIIHVKTSGSSGRSRGNAGTKLFFC